MLFSGSENDGSMENRAPQRGTWPCPPRPTASGRGTGITMVGAGNSEPEPSNR